MRVAIACAFHESNTFARGSTARADFGSWRTRAELLELAGTQTATGGFLDACRDAGWEPVPALHAWATPAGVVERDAFDALERDLARTLRGCGAIDGLLLELHGAMVADGVEQADLRLAEAARRAVGAVPIVAVLDPHGNLAPGLTDVVDAVIAYQTNPHVDMSAAGRRGAELLGRIAADPRPVGTTIVRVPVVAPAIAQASADEPLASILERAHAAEAHPDVWAASIFFGFAYADVPALGMHVAVTGPDPALRVEQAAALAGACWDGRQRFARRLPDAAEAMRLAAAAERLAVVADTGDNVGGGAAGDESELLAAALTYGGPRFAAAICDPAAVSTARAADVGATLEVALGRPPLAVTAQVRRVGPGRYRNRGPLSAGVEFDPGDVAVLGVGRGEILVQSRAVMANDQNLFAANGIDIDGLDAVLLKGAAAVRAGWRDRDPVFIDAGTRGATPSDLSTLDYRRAERPLFPLDPIA